MPEQTLQPRRQAPIESTDYMTPEVNGEIDFGSLPTGGLSLNPVTEREFDTTKADGKLEYERFMAMPVVIEIHTTGNKNEAPVVELGLNGQKVVLPRGKRVRLPRAYVEILARSQTRHYEQVRDPNPHADEGMRTRRSGGTDYPFQVIADGHPKGRAWLERITRESA